MQKTKSKSKPKASKRRAVVSAQQTIPYVAMHPDGICQLPGGLYTKTVEYEDINYAVASTEDQTAIFGGWSSFLNYFDSSLPFQLSFVNRRSRSTHRYKVNIRSGRRSSPERLPRRRPIASATKRRCAGRRASTPFSLPPTQTASISITIFTTILLRWIVPGSSGISSARPALCGGSRIGCVWKMTCP